MRKGHESTKTHQDATSTQKGNGNRKDNGGHDDGKDSSNTIQCGMMDDTYARQDIGRRQTGKGKRGEWMYRHVSERLGERRLSCSRDEHFHRTVRYSTVEYSTS
jgi:hypothetical protein